MGFTPDMVRVSNDRKYAARVFLDHIQTGNVSVFRDRWLIVHQTFLEVKEENDMVEDWLAGDED